MYIVLIPKIRNSVKITNSRPISLGNVVYELISKVLANRLKQVSPNVISENQGAFVPWRLITDDTLVAYEGVNSCIEIETDGKKMFYVYKTQYEQGVWQDGMEFCWESEVEAGLLEKMGFFAYGLHFFSVLFYFV